MKPVHLCKQNQSIRLRSISSALDATSRDYPGPAIKCTLQNAQSDHLYRGRICTGQQKSKRSMKRVILDRIRFPLCLSPCFLISLDKWKEGERDGEGKARHSELISEGARIPRRRESYNCIQRRESELSPRGTSMCQDGDGLGARRERDAVERMMACWRNWGGKIGWWTSAAAEDNWGFVSVQSFRAACMCRATLGKINSYTIFIGLILFS